MLGATAYPPDVRQRLVAHWWVWLLIAAVAVVGNELFDRRYVGVYKNGYPLGDVLVAVVIVGIVFYVSGFVARRKSRRAP